jgi:hypothetical protein
VVAVPSQDQVPITRRRGDGRPRTNLFEEWEIQPSHIVDEKWFTASVDLHPFLDPFQIPFRSLEDTQKREYGFSRVTLSAWCRFFVSVLRGVKERAKNCDVSPGSIDDLSSFFSLLSLILYNNWVFETLLAVPSLSNRMQVHRMGLMMTLVSVSGTIVHPITYASAFQPNWRMH